MAMKRKKMQSGIAVAMRKRYPRSLIMTARNEKRRGDHKKSWRRDWD